MKTIKKYLSSVVGWVKQNPIEFLVLLGVLLLGAFLRLYKIDQYMTFLGDEGRDVLIVRRIFTEFHPPLIGPGTSVGNMYLGPLYYYMMALPLLISGFSPVGPAVMVALLGVVTIGFVWFVTRKWFGKIAGFTAAILYAISPTIITFSHSSWNPNIMPFFSLLSMYAIWKVWKENELNWLIVLGFSFAFVLQSHYLGLFLLPVIFVYWLLKLINTKNKGILKIFIRKSILAFVAFIMLMSPLFIFDLRHNFLNTKALIKLIADRNSTVSINLFDIVKKIPSTLQLIVNDILGVRLQMPLLILVLFLVLVGLAIFIKKYKEKQEVVFVISWLLFALIGFSFYKLPIYDHYMGLIFVVPFILIGEMFERLCKLSKFTSFFTVLMFAVLFIVNLSHNPFKSEPNRQLNRAQNVAKTILDLDNDKPFNLAVLAQTNYEDGYRYFLELWGGKVLHADRWDTATISDQLFVVCEYPEEKCDPTHSPKAEVANFGMTKIDGQWSVDGVIIYRLIHTK